MSIEESVFIEEIFNYSHNKDAYNLLGVNWSYEYGNLLGKALEKSSIAAVDDSLACLDNFEELWGTNSNSVFQRRTDVLVQPLVISDELTPLDGTSEELTPLDGSTTTTPSSMSSRQKRHRRRSGKNKEEIEKQRITHIAVERGRRKQMNDYLSQLKQLMPESYVHKNDQASIVGGAINYVKDLEKQQHFLSGQKQSKQNFDSDDVASDDHQSSSSSNSPFSEFFTFPQYSSSTTTATHDQYFYHDNVAMTTVIDHGLTLNPTPAADDIEVTMVENHASIKIRSKRQRSKQKLLQIVSGLHSLRFTILHLSVTTVDQFVLYSISVKVEDDCKLISGDGIATAINQMLESFK